MSNISILISNIRPHLPFASELNADKFLKNYSLDDQCAFISALYIGRDHLNSDDLNHDYVDVNGIPIVPIDRFYTTGNDCQYFSQSDFARVLYEKNTALSKYYASFLKCIPHQYLIAF